MTRCRGKRVSVIDHLLNVRPYCLLMCARTTRLNSSFFKCLDANTSSSTMYVYICKFRVAVAATAEAMAVSRATGGDTVVLVVVGTARRQWEGMLRWPVG